MSLDFLHQLGPGWLLAGQLVMLSIFAVGGAHTVYPDVYRYIVNEQAWMSGATFASLVALAQAAPGPNMLVFAMFGYQLQGLIGAFAAGFAFCVLPIVFSYAIARFSSRAENAPWKQIVAAGLAPLTVGVVLASATIIAQGAGGGWFGYVLTAATATLAIFTRWNPLWLIIVGAAIAIFVY
jgi:chromate transporter